MHGIMRNGRMEVISDDLAGITDNQVLSPEEATACVHIDLNDSSDTQRWIDWCDQQGAPRATMDDLLAV